MLTVLLGGSAFALLAWLGVLLAPWQAYRLRERLEAAAAAESDADLAAVTVLVPARDEAETIGRVVAALARQGHGLRAIVVDDQSTDGTSSIALTAARDGGLALEVVAGKALPGGWAGKLWALEQGLEHVDTPFVLLLDADIELAPRMLPTLLAEARRRDATLVSLMAELNRTTSWETLLTPAFVFFFKLLYPFALSNDPARRTAAAAGGCMLVRAQSLRDIGGFAGIRGALIDDCTLAAALKRARPPIWLGVTQSVKSLRVYAKLDDFWNMVARSAFTQLRYSTALLLLVTALMLAVLLAPPIALAAGAAMGDVRLASVGAAAWLAMSAAYRPVIRLYRLPTLAALGLPLAGAFFLAMTWSSALRYWRGTRATWKNRSYDAVR